jgi:HAD superfamily hydrolase (TIGR01459 family)
LPADPRSIPWFPGFGPLAERYDGFILDLWGVIHDGVRPYPGAAETLDRLIGLGKPFVMLSNAPRRAAAVAAGMRAMGFREAHTAPIMCSGEATWQDLKDRADPWYRHTNPSGMGTGNRLYHIGPERDADLFSGLGAVRVERVADAALILNTGPWRDEEKVADYEDVLQAGVAAGIGMVCANPDLEVIRGGKRIICAGALALHYESLGGRVRWLGKPHPPIYDRCFEMLDERAGRALDRRRLLAVGDSLRTDIAGAMGVGVDAALVLGGLHGAELGAVPDAAGVMQAPPPGRVEAFCAAAGVRPVAALPSFVW